jgi:hypothetical protein
VSIVILKILLKLKFLGQKLCSSRIEMINTPADVLSESASKVEVILGDHTHCLSKLYLTTCIPLEENSFIFLPPIWMPPLNYAGALLNWGKFLVSPSRRYSLAVSFFSRIRILSPSGISRESGCFSG